MEKINSELTKKEQDILEHRGFYVKNNITFYNMLVSYFVFLALHYVGGFGMLFISVIITTLLFGINGYGSLLSDFFMSRQGILYSQIPLLIIMIMMFTAYIFHGKEFYGAMSPKIGFVGKYIQYCTNKAKSILQIGNGNSILISIILGCLSLFSIEVFSMYLRDNYYIFGIDPDWYLSMVLNITLGFYGGGFILRQLVEIFHPLYAFGNIGEKIQKITPQIGVQSKLIEEGFKKDMNFRILHASFEKLSSTFSEIISLVIRLEKAEKRAKKGNIFDSEKYINSLRLDIVTPLATLKAFLEKQRDELVASGEELTIVRVKVGGEKGEGNLDLASKRSNSLLPELERNIKALDRMIGKLG